MKNILGQIWIAIIRFYSNVRFGRGVMNLNLRVEGLGPETVEFLGGKFHVTDKGHFRKNHIQGLLLMNGVFYINENLELTKVISLQKEGR